MSNRHVTRMLALPFALLALAGPSPSSQTDVRDLAGRIGLLELPGIFGDPDACGPRVPATATVYREPSAQDVLGVISVTRVAAPEADGGCRPAEVKVTADGGTEAELPVAEHAYEALAVIVLEQRPGWFRIRMPEGSGWVQAAPDRRFHPLEELVSTGLTYLTAHWDGLFSTTPGGRRFRPAQAPAPGEPVAVLRITRARNMTWALVETAEGCDGPRPATWKPVRGWVPLYDADRHPTLWFYSRGC